MAVTTHASCVVEGCGPSRSRLRRGYCSRHYTALWKYGDPLAAFRRPNGSEPYAALLFHGHNRVGECFIYKGQKSKKGYGVVMAPGTTRALSAHRVSFEKWNGPIPTDVVVDHVCHNKAAQSGACDGGNECVHRACINPAHLRLVTAQENSAASPHGSKATGASAINKAKTHCPRGHAYEDGNVQLRTRKNGVISRECKTCITLRRQQ